MAKPKDQLIAMIDELVEKRTFGLDALDAIKSLRERAEAQAMTIENLRSDVSMRDDQLRRKSEIIAMLETDNKKLEGEREGVLAREKNVVALERETAVAVARLEAFRECTGMFLKNTIVREQIQTSTPVPMQNAAGGGTYVTPHATVQNVRREEE